MQSFFSNLTTNCFFQANYLSCKALYDDEEDDNDEVDNNDDDDDNVDNDDDDKEDTDIQVVLSGKYFLHNAVDLQAKRRKREQINIKK